MITVAAVGLVAIAAMALPPGAEAGFSSQLVPISNPAPGGNTSLSDVAIATDGEALIAWSEGDATNVVAKLRRVQPDGSMGPELTISDGTQRGLAPSVSIAPNGRALVAWVENISSAGPSLVRARWVEPDDTLGPQITVRNGGLASDSGELTVSATSTNAALVAWHNFTSIPGPFRRVEARRITPEGTIGALIFPASGAGSTGVEAAADSSGGTLLAWREGPPVHAQSVAASDVPGALQTPSTETSAQPSLATDGSDHFQLLYRKGAGPSSLEYRALAADGTFGPEQTLDPAGSILLGPYDVATNAPNRSLAAWTRPVDADQQAINARFIGSDGTPEAATFTTTVASAGPSGVEGAIGGSGSAAIAWTGSSTLGVSSVWGQILPVGATPSAPMLLSSETGGPSFALIEMAANDVGVSAWRESIDPTSQAHIMLRQILPSPVCPDATGTVIQGRPTQVDLACSGLQLEAPQVVDPPAHGTLAPPDAATQSVVYTPTPGFKGADSFTFTGANRGGTGATQTTRLTVGKDTVKPKMKKFKITQKRVRLSRAPAQGERRKPAFKLRYSEIATATIVIERRSECTGKGCKKFKKLGKLKAKPAAISDKVVLGKRVGKRRLRPGAYRARAVAQDPAGNDSKVKRLKFEVLRP